MSIASADKSRYQVLAEVQKKFHTQAGEVFRLQRNFESMSEIVKKQKQEIKKLHDTHNGLQIEHKLKNEELKSMQEIADAHKDAKEHAHHLLKISQDEHAELKTLHDQLLGLFNAKDAEGFKKTLNAKIAKLESMIDQEADMAAIQEDFNIMEKNFKASVERKKALKHDLDARDARITQYENMKSMYNDLSDLHESIKADHIAEKDAITKAFEAEISITKKEHAALKDMHDQLLIDFGAGDAEQFKRDLNRKIGDFESLISEQAKQIKDLQAKLGSSFKLRERMKADHAAEKDAMAKTFEAELSITKKEHDALKNMHKQLLADFNAGDAEQFKRDLNKKIGNFESLIDEQEKQIKDVQEKLGSSINLHESIKADHIAEKNAIAKAFEAQLSISKKEHAALKDIHDQLLNDFNAGDAIQFKRDLNRKIDDFESLIDEQKKNIKDLQAKLESSSKLRESISADHTAEKDAITKDFEAKHNITKKEYAALKSMHDQLLIDFGADNAEQFKQDLNNKIDKFKSFINQQEKQIEELQAKLGSSFNLRDSMKADHIAEKNAIAKAFEAQLSISKKERDHLLSNFNAGGTEQFRDVNKKNSGLDWLESLIATRNKNKFNS